jgi:hypothetical protein
VFGEGST